MTSSYISKKDAVNALKKYNIMYNYVILIKINNERERKMPIFTIKLEISGYVEFEIEADDEQSAEEIARDKPFDSDEAIDADINYGDATVEVS